MPSIGQNLQPFTGNGGLHMSEKFSSGTINPKQTNKQKHNWNKFDFSILNKAMLIIRIEVHEAQWFQRILYIFGVIFVIFLLSPKRQCLHITVKKLESPIPKSGLCQTWSNLANDVNILQADY